LLSQAVQLHGGMGVTNELRAVHHFKRLTMIKLTLGDTDIIWRASWHSRDLKTPLDRRSHQGGNDVATEVVFRRL
jgi:hypothetical protein